MRWNVQAFVSLLLTGCLMQAFGAGPSIGIAMASGKFQIDRSEVQGNASVFDGSELTTLEASSKLRMNNGARVELGTDSHAKIFTNYAVLDRGAGQVEGAPSYALEVLKLRVTSAVPRAIARVRLDGPDTVVVSAVNGPVRVLSPAGVLVASVGAGRSFRFQPQGGSEAFELTGCLLKKSGRFIIVDQTTNQVFEIRGTEAADQLGNRVLLKGTAATGATPIEGARQVISASSVTPVAPGGCLATAAAVGADPLPGSTAVPAATQTTAAHGPNKAVIAGVIVAAGAAAGIGVALSGGNKSK